MSLGAAKLELGEDEGGFADLEESIELARSLGSPEAIRGNITLAHQLRHHGRFLDSLTPFEEALRLSETFGIAPQRRMLAGMLPQMRYRRGRWDEALEAANAYLEEVGARTTTRGTPCRHVDFSGSPGGTSLVSRLRATSRRPGRPSIAAC